MKYLYPLVAILGATTVMALPTGLSPSSHKRDILSPIADDIIARDTTTLPPIDEDKLKAALLYAFTHKPTKRGFFDWVNDAGDWFKDTWNSFTKRDGTELTDEDKAKLTLLYLTHENDNGKRGLFDWVDDVDDWFNDTFSKA